MERLKLIHGFGEIKKIDKQIREAFKLIDDVNVSLISVKNNYKLIDKIKDLGFKFTSSSGATFIGKSQVIKVGLVTRPPPPLKYRIPTLTYDYEERKLHINNWDWVFVLMIQPKIDTDNFDGYSDEHTYQMGKIEKKLIGTDFHEDNFGLYKGEVKLLDW